MSCLLFALADKGRRYEITSGSHAGSARLTLDYAAGGKAVSRRRSARKAAKTLYRFFVFHKIFGYLRRNAAGFIHFPHERPLAPLVPEGRGIDPPTTEEYIHEYFANYLMDPTDQRRIPWKGLKRTKAHA